MTDLFVCGQSGGFARWKVEDNAPPDTLGLNQWPANFPPAQLTAMMAQVRPLLFFTTAFNRRVYLQLARLTTAFNRQGCPLGLNQWPANFPPAQLTAMMAQVLAVVCTSPLLFFTTAFNTQEFPTYCI